MIQPCLICLHAVSCLFSHPPPSPLPAAAAARTARLSCSIPSTARPPPPNYPQTRGDSGHRIELQTIFAARTTRHSPARLYCRKTAGGSSCCSPRAAAARAAAASAARWICEERSEPSARPASSAAPRSSPGRPPALNGASKEVRCS